MQGTTTPDNGERKVAFDVKVFIWTGMQQKKPIKTRLQQTDTRWARAALTAFEYADVKVF